MHQSSLTEMKRVLQARFRGHRLMVLDVGSRVVGTDRRTYRGLMRPEWTYLGCDVEAGENVDLVMPSPYQIPAEMDEAVDVVISGQCLEHVERPWRLVPEMARALKPGGTMVITAPWTWAIHRFPVDCWRILPDGMRVLLEDAGLTVEASYTVQNDCWGIGRRV